MPRNVFVDTSCWLAIADKSEKRHARVSDVYQELLKTTTLLVTSDLVIAETQILLRRRLGSDAARVFLDGINNSPSIEVLFLDAAMEMAVKEILKKFSDQELSFTDASAFTMMRSRKIKTAFTLDHHFALAGFLMIPNELD